MKTETNPQYLEVGKALMGLTRAHPLTTILMSLLFPLHAKRMNRLVQAITPLIERGVFGSDEELGL